MKGSGTVESFGERLNRAQGQGPSFTRLQQGFGTLSIFGVDYKVKMHHFIWGLDLGLDYDYSDYDWNQTHTTFAYTPWIAAKINVKLHTKPHQVKTTLFEWFGYWNVVSASSLKVLGLMCLINMICTFWNGVYLVSCISYVMTYRSGSSSVTLL